MNERTKFFFWSGAVVAALLIGLLGGVIPLWDRLENEKKVSEEIYQNLVKVRQAPENFNYAQESKLIEKKLSLLNAKLIETGNQAKVISLLTQLIEKVGLSVSAIEQIDNPKEDAGEEMTDEAEIRSVYFRVEMEGSFQRLGVFFKSLEKNRLALTVKEMTLTSHEMDPLLLKSKLLIAAYERQPVKT